MSALRQADEAFALAAAPVEERAHVRGRYELVARSGQKQNRHGDLSVSAVSDTMSHLVDDVNGSPMLAQQEEEGLDRRQDVRNELAL